MLSDDDKARLFSLAATDRDRQLLVAAMRSGLKETTEHGLFELLTQYVMIGAVAYLVAEAASYVFALISPKWSLWAGLAAFAGTILAINLGMDGDAGRRRKEWLAATARKYVHFATLAVGLLIGGAYHGYTERTSWEGEAKQATLAACADIPACLSLAQRYNQGNDVAQYLPSPGR
ncbi:hypothetical protein EJ074_11815 [Mesorhizobium sp. M3A.F.Ca.ET.080.04.2.1]|uniref:hypothetical protein n=1 Tax=Mesorhizobium sp. M3A.F.Ca.ET.080.04.2.1 TaxID=2493676 RepID=UPI000F7524A7|nr:hypothetical protein [Mesorhizobium sp. M3A.F.Ca.ET.080.04.2.1]AZO09711.1 hypothetical protein EJ074_11815 [Mesorhizobium sp. M3A.F.Ca.ET.080.04.2.1]RWF24300.1 MAG: hypothetical protein EOS64_08195 [Mesorhizobium sp.]TGT57715.1 hypothetical protein EN813_037470 [Mesorhizobium sp. M00.F.Ca.ET.170.01.1.1]